MFVQSQVVIPTGSVDLSIVPVKRSQLVVFECMGLSIGQRVIVSGVSCVSNNVLRCWDSYNVICDLIHHLYIHTYIHTYILSMRRWSEGRQFRSFSIKDTKDIIQDTRNFISCRFQSTNNISSKSYFPTNISKKLKKKCKSYNR